MSCLPSAVDLSLFARGIQVDERDLRSEQNFFIVPRAIVEHIDFVLNRSRTEAPPRHGEPQYLPTHDRVPELDIIHRNRHEAMPGKLRLRPGDTVMFHAKNNSGGTTRGQSEPQDIIVL